VAAHAAVVAAEAVVAVDETCDLVHDSGFEKGVWEQRDRVDLRKNSVHGAVVVVAAAAAAARSGGLGFAVVASVVVDVAASVAYDVAVVAGEGVEEEGAWIASWGDFVEEEGSSGEELEFGGVAAAVAVDNSVASDVAAVVAVVAGVVDTVADDVAVVVAAVDIVAAVVAGGGAAVVVEVVVAAKVSAAE
jgi:hypothetical protein